MITQSIGQRIREVRLNKHLTQAALAEKINSSTAAISSYEQGKKMPGIDVLSRLSDALGVTIDYLYKGSTANDPLRKSTDKASLIINCICALQKEGVFKQKYTPSDNVRLNPVQTYIDKYYEVISDLIFKLDNLQESRTNYDNPDFVEAEYVKMAINQIRNMTK